MAGGDKILLTYTVLFIMLRGQLWKEVQAYVAAGEKLAMVVLLSWKMCFMSLIKFLAPLLIGDKEGMTL